MRRDWKKYNRELVRRGEILIDPQVMAVDQKRQKKRGRPYTYPEQLIMLLLFLKFALRLPYRQTEGVARKVFGGLGIKIPNFRTLHYRLSRGEFRLKELPEVEELPEDFIIVLDSSGLKVTNRGEWIRRKWGKRPRKGWVKVHVAFDLQSRQVVELEVTDERTPDCKKAKELVEGAKEKAEGKGKKIKKVIADAGYDTHEFFRYLGKEGIEPAVLVRRGARIGGNPCRDKVIRGIRRGKRKWKRAVGYGKRWIVEGFFSMFKRWFGEYVSSVKFENIKKELVFKVAIANTFLAMSSG